LRLRPGPPRIDAPLLVRIGRRVLVWVLRLLTAVVLRRYRPIVVAITGSVGKTTTKDLTAAVLATRFKLRATEGSANSEVAVPATVFGSRRGRSVGARALLLLDGLILVLLRRPFPELLVLELAAGRPGELERLTRSIRPDVAVVTHLRPVHRMHYRDFEELVREKSWPIRRLRASGTAVLNRDDPRFRELAEIAPRRLVTFGSAPDADVRLASADLGLDGTTARLHIGGAFAETGPLPVWSRLLGSHQLTGVLAAVAVGLSLGVPANEALEALSGFEPAPGRLRAHRIPGGAVVLDDSYNASPQAMVEALEVLTRFPRPRWAVLGSMTELGPEEATGHRTAGEAAATRSDVLLAVGPHAKLIAEAAAAEGMAEEKILVADDAETAAGIVAAQSGLGSVLVKGSAAYGLEAVVTALVPEAEVVSRPPRLRRPDRA
jgi:UDP-N-acetylmuramoyl-tripeptide--D-alanyl-D-alanine ligase